MFNSQKPKPTTTIRSAMKGTKNSASQPKKVTVNSVFRTYSTEQTYPVKDYGYKSKNNKFKSTSLGPTIQENVLVSHLPVQEVPRGFVVNFNDEVQNMYEPQSQYHDETIENTKTGISTYYQGRNNRKKGLEMFNERNPHSTSSDDSEIELVDAPYPKVNVANPNYVLGSWVGAESLGGGFSRKLKRKSRKHNKSHKPHKKSKSHKNIKHHKNKKHSRVFTHKKH